MTKSEQRLAQFLYVLMRDYLPTGKVEEIVQGHVEALPEGTAVSFSNSHLAMYACELAKRIGNA